MKSAGLINYLVLWCESAVRYVRGEVGVVDSTEGETIGPAAAEIGDFNILQKTEKMIAAHENKCVPLQ